MARDTIAQELDAFHKEEAAAYSVAYGVLPGTAATITSKIKYIHFKTTLKGKKVVVAVSPAPNAPPIVTGGFPIINIVPRPQRTSLTIPVGFTPVTIDVPIQFDAWSSGNAADALTIENDIAALEWMYGRGAANGGPGALGIGPPPEVQVTTLNGSGQTIPLLSLNWQSTATNPLAYNITNIAWDANPLRVPANGAYGGMRLRQDAVVSLQQVVSEPAFTVRRSQTHQTTAAFIFITNGTDTFLSIAETAIGSSKDKARVTRVAQAIMDTYFNAGGKALHRSLHAPQPKGVHINVTTADQEA